jgi:hypothetical protein
MKRVLLIIFVFCSVSIFAQQDGKEIYVDKVNDFIISYPDEWDLEQGQEGEIVLYPPFAKDAFEQEYAQGDLDADSDENNPSQMLEEKIQFTPSRWDEGDLEEFVDKNFLSVDFSEFFDGFTIIKEGNEKINGKNALWYIATFNVGEERAISYFYFIKMFNRIIAIVSFCKEEDFELNYKIKYLEIIRSTKSYLDSMNKKR